MEENKKGINFKKFFLNIVLPSLLSILLFIVLIFWYVIPYFETNLLNSKKEMIRELVNSTLSIANKSYQDYQSGMISEEEAKNDAINIIENLRYGVELKDYFFITDLRPFMIMHPYRPDLNGTDLSNHKDPNGKTLFVEMVEKIKSSGEGFVDYKWQWMDDSLKTVPKVSYVAEFKPWGWVIGTGIYIEDVREKIAEIESELILVSIIISSIIALLLTVIVFQNFRSEKKRSIAEKELMISKEKYKTLVEASTEGTAMILGGKLIYSNKLFDNLFESSRIQVFSEDLRELFPVKNNDSVQKVKSFISGELGYVQFETAIAATDSRIESVLLSLSKIKLNDEDGLILIIKELTGEPLSVSEKNKWSKHLIELLRKTKSAMFSVSLSDSGRFVDCNEFALQILAFPSRTDLLKITINDIIEDQREGIRIFRLVRTTGVITDYMLKIRTYDGRLITVLLNAQYEKDELTLNEYISGTFRDISKQAELEAIREQTFDDIRYSLMQLNSEIKLFQRETISCNSKLSAGNATKLMVRYNTSILVVRSDDGMPLGVITDTDVRTRIIPNISNLDRPVSTFMSSPVIFLPGSATLSEALILMQNRGIHHLVVEGIPGEITGYIGTDELLESRMSTSQILLQAVKDATTLEELQNIYRRIPFFSTSSVDRNVNPEFILRTIAKLADYISSKLAEMIFLEIGEPPVDFAFISLGSEGRGEQTLTSDQDNALIYDDSDADKIPAAEEYFARFAERMNYMLDSVGYSYCTGDVMARNPKWNQPLTKWKSYFREWINNPEPQNLLEIAVFFDMKLTYGSQKLLDELQTYVFDQLGHNPSFYNFLARVGTSYKIQLSIFGRIQTESTDEFSKSVNVKNPIRVIVHLVRLYAMKNHLTETNTLKRLKILYEKNLLSEMFYKELVYSYNFLTLLQIKSQLSGLKSHSKLVNQTDIKTLTSIELNILKNVFSLISSFQSKLKYDFGIND